MKAISRRVLARWLLRNGFEQSPGSGGHFKFTHSSGVAVTLPGHGRPELSQKHFGMILRSLEQAGFDKGKVREELSR